MACLPSGIGFVPHFVALFLGGIFLQLFATRELCVHVLQVRGIAYRMTVVLKISVCVFIFDSIFCDISLADHFVLYWQKLFVLFFFCQNLFGVCFLFRLLVCELLVISWICI